MPVILLIFVGAGCGGVLRWGVSALGERLLPVSVLGFPIGTLVVNLLGSLAFGLIAALWGEQPAWVRPLVLVGLLGGFTTFSAFSAATVDLLAAGRWVLAGTYVVVSVVSCVLGAALGLALGRVLQGWS